MNIQLTLIIIVWFQEWATRWILRRGWVLVNSVNWATQLSFYHLTTSFRNAPVPISCLAVISDFEPFVRFYSFVVGVVLLLSICPPFFPVASPNLFIWFVVVFAFRSSFCLSSSNLVSRLLNCNQFYFALSPWNIRYRLSTGWISFPKRSLVSNAR